jgi:hypothetical protein
LGALEDNKLLPSNTLRLAGTRFWQKQVHFADGSVERAFPREPGGIKDEAVSKEGHLVWRQRSRENLRKRRPREGGASPSERYVSDKSARLLRGNAPEGQGLVQGAGKLLCLGASFVHGEPENPGLGPRRKSFYGAQAHPEGSLIPSRLLKAFGDEGKGSFWGAPQETEGDVEVRGANPSHLRDA